ncbi:DNA methyltransferase [Litoreibacter roseus]|uniref:Methyltransferase n=1 Tax=Litoreibacter roseus TaxID=2601869 RepID=A0A6N6JJV6_9RHOB|nr:DNA methyltransferase [Litoreibacter roseus]GFE65558.1 methyltransferase [Litoreibacter roseus]
MQRNQIIHGEAAQELMKMADGSVDLVVTDPPYLVNYKDRTGRSLLNDDNAAGVLPVFEPLARVLKNNAYCISFCGWSALPSFTAAWENAGLQIVSQIVWKKKYASRTGYTQYRHETAYVLAKGNPAKPARPIADVQDWVYSGNKRHPTEKAVEVISPLIRCFSNPGDTVLDPFSGSGSTSVAAVLNDREFIGIELEKAHCETARARVAGAQAFKTRQNGVAREVAA